MPSKDRDTIGDHIHAVPDLTPVFHPAATRDRPVTSRAHGFMAGLAHAPGDPAQGHMAADLALVPRMLEGAFSHDISYAVANGKNTMHSAVLPRELPSNSGKAPSLQFLLCNLLIYREILVDALGLEPRTR